jgi:hypothetical protein
MFDMQTHRFHCDFTGCDFATKPVEQEMMPPDWAHVELSSQLADRHTVRARVQLCPKHAEAVGRLFKREWRVSEMRVDEPPDRFKP